jgi:hypothetical protein
MYKIHVHATVMVARMNCNEIAENCKYDVLLRLLCPTNLRSRPPSCWTWVWWKYCGLKSELWFWYLILCSSIYSTDFLKLLILWFCYSWWDFVIWVRCSEKTIWNYHVWWFRSLYCSCQSWRQDRMSCYLPYKLPNFHNCLVSKFVRINFLCNCVIS